MSVSAIIVTRGDHDLGEILDSLPGEWERIIWDNHGGITIYENEADWRGDGPPQPDNWADLSVYGRYAAIEHASHEIIYVQDDDCVVSDPMEIVGSYISLYESRLHNPHNVIVCNMPPEFRHGFYEEHSLVGFGTAFHRDAPERSFEQFWNRSDDLGVLSKETLRAGYLFQRTCDVVFTALTPRVLVDVPKRNLPWADGPDRMYRQPEHQAERGRMLELAFRARDADA